MSVIPEYRTSKAFSHHPLAAKMQYGVPPEKSLNYCSLAHLRGTEDTQYLGGTYKYGADKRTRGQDIPKHMSSTIETG